MPRELPLILVRPKVPQLGAVLLCLLQKRRRQLGRYGGALAVAAAPEDVASI